MAGQFARARTRAPRNGRGLLLVGPCRLRWGFHAATATSDGLQVQRGRVAALPAPARRLAVRPSSGPGPELS